MIDVSVVGANIANLRRNQKLSQEQLAELAGLSTNYLARVERGEVQNFSAINLLKIANALNTSVDELAQGAQKKTTIKQKPNQRELNSLLNNMNEEISEELCKIFVKTIKVLAKKR